MNSISSPANTRTSPSELKVQLFLDEAESSIPPNYMFFTEENLLIIECKEKVETSAVTKQSREAALRKLGDRGEEPSEVHKYQDKEAASVSPDSDQDSEGKETISGEEEEEEDKDEAASASSHSESIFGGVEDKEAFSLSPYSIRKETISGEDKKAALLSSPSGRNTTTSGGEGEKKAASLSSHTLRHQTVSADQEEDNEPTSVSPYSGPDSEGNGSISGSDEDKESASISPRSEANKTIFVCEQDNEAVSLFSSSDRDSEGYKRISAREVDRAQASYSPYSDGYSKRCKTISRSKEDKGPGLLSPYSAIDSEWKIFASVCDEEAKEVSASPKLVHGSARALTTSACEEKAEENKETEKYETYVELFIRKVVYHIYIKANMDPQCNNDLIMCLHQYIWEKVKDEDMCITDASFKKMNNKIHKVLHKQFGNPNKVLFLLKYSDKPVVADCMVSILRQLLKKPSKKSNIFSRFFFKVSQIL